MPSSVGIDIVEIDRIRKAVDTNAERFLRKVFAPEEISFCLARADSMACLAARFAAKEAFRKAIRASVTIAWRDIVVLHKDNGVPSLRLVSEAARGLTGNFILSLSHSRDYAVAVVLWETG